MRKSRAKYKAGGYFRSINEVANATMVYVIPWKRAVSASWIFNASFATICSWARAGAIVKATLIKKGGANGTNP